MPAHASAVPLTDRPAWSWGLVPALLVCLAAPAFFVLRIPWLGWVLLAAGLVAAWVVSRGRDADEQTTDEQTTDAAASVRPRVSCATCR